MSVLNDVDKIRGLDPENMYNRIFDLPEQITEALNIGRGWKFDSSEFSDIKNITVIGMGGSAIGGDLVRTYLASKLQIPFQVCRHYQLPEYVDDESLVIASSYSGNTEETLAALDDALARKAMIAGITTGGMLKEVATLNSIPLAILPAGLQPRAALGYSFVPLMLFLEKIGLAKNATKRIESVAVELATFREKYIEDATSKDNPAKSLAQKIHHRIPIIYTGPTLTDTVGIRWKGQICENSKNLAFANQFAEFNHNELVGWSTVAEEHKEHLIVIILRDEDDHARVSKRMDIVKELIEQHRVEVVEVYSQGSSSMARMFQLIQMGDFVSYYLAVLNEVDPSPVKVIESLKKSLAE